MVGAVAQERALEGRFQERVQAIDIVAVTWDGEQERNTTFRGEDKVLASTVEVHLQRGAIAGCGQPVETFVVFCPHELTDVDGM